MITLKQKLAVALLSSGFAMQPAQGEIFQYQPGTLREVPLVPYAQVRMQAVAAGGIGMLGFAIFQHLYQNLSKELFPDRPLLQSAASIGCGFVGKEIYKRPVINMLNLLGSARWHVIRDTIPGTAELDFTGQVEADEHIQEEVLKDMKETDSQLSKILFSTKMRATWDVEALQSFPMKVLEIVSDSQIYAFMFMTFATYYGLLNERPAIATDADGDIAHIRRYSPEEIKRRAQITYFAAWGGLRWWLSACI